MGRAGRSLLLLSIVCYSAARTDDAATRKREDTRTDDILARLYGNTSVYESTSATPRSDDVSTRSYDRTKRDDISTTSYDISKRLYKRSNVSTISYDKTRLDEFPAKSYVRANDKSTRVIRRSSRSDDIVRVAVLLPNATSYLSSIGRVGPAIQLATYVSGLKWNFTYLDSNCSAAWGLFSAIQGITDHQVHLFLGPVCDFVAAPIGRILKYWEVPLVTAGAFARDYGLPKTQSNDEYFLVTRVGLTFNGAGDFLLSVFELFGGWQRAVLYYDEKAWSEVAADNFCTLFTKGIVEEMRSRGGYVWVSPKVPTTLKREDAKAILMKEVGTDYAVVVMCVSPETTRELLLAADDLGMIDSGEYIFFSVELFTSKKVIRNPWYRSDDDDKVNDQARKVYQALMTLTASVPETEEFEKFSRKVKDLAKTDFGFKYGEQEEINGFVTAFHDAVILYALALNDTLADGFEAKNGAEVTKRMWNRTFQGITGNVSIDMNGDRTADYSLLSMDPETGDFRVVVQYLGKSGEVFKVHPVKWPGGREGPPPDTPRCGFDLSKCPKHEVSQWGIVSGVLAGALFLLAVLSFYIYRHFKLEAELASMTWLIRWEELCTVGSGPGLRSRKTGSKLSLARISLVSSFSAETQGYVSRMQDLGKQSSYRTALYKGVLVAVKPLRKTRIDLTRSLLLQLKKMKDLQHDHLVRLLGACVDAPNCCIVTEYCPKGSLQDILENDQINLDWMFRYSLIHDIIRGMAYLHGSEVRSHGNLKSSNCVVDSRFVLKITDFGLHSLRYDPQEDNTQSNAYWRRKLWTAPELLRMSNPPTEGTVKGDIFAFAVVLHEIVVRKGPFYLGPQQQDSSPKDIVSRVKSGDSLRPLVKEEDGDEELLHMMRRCWSEEPGERPDFQALKALIRRLNKDNESGNILDNLLSRMEQYANNLEALVEERTADYLEEKRKAEDLLYQLLPKSVASQLIKGESVRAESFDSVTIYFSDIVGFTSLSAQSTPMQVVDLLNELYTCFDSILESFDVYKVETIGDAYMVVSGLPVRNGQSHAREIARMSLALLAAVHNFKIRHRPQDQLKLRIGLHSGPCAAGVVGHKMPRYCLFGDTVNTASRMESTGMPLKIHVSPETKGVLDSFGSFHLELRGEIEMKGKGKMTTFWLKGETNPITIPLPTDNETKL